MRNMSEEFMALPTLCWVWRITLKNADILGFTDHDRPLMFEETLCAPQSGFTPQSREQRLGLSVDESRIDGILDSDIITAEAIKAGDFDHAKIDMFRVNWQTPSEYAAVSSGFLGDIQLRGNAFEVDILGQDALLERASGRVFSRMCDAEFGDSRCGVNPEVFPDGTACPRSFSACRDQFSNTLNFQGFPYLLGDDALLAGPVIGEVRDGSSRYP